MGNRRVRTGDDIRDELDRIMRQGDIPSFLVQRANVPVPPVGFHVTSLEQVQSAIEVFVF